MHFYRVGTYSLSRYKQPGLVYVLGFQPLNVVFRVTNIEIKDLLSIELRVILIQTILSSMLNN